MEVGEVVLELSFDSSLGLFACKGSEGFPFNFAAAEKLIFCQEILFLEAPVGLLTFKPKE